MFGFKSLKKKTSSFFSRHSSYSHLKSNQFTKRQFEIAALWWAQYLPGVKNVNFEEINQHSNLENVQIMNELHKFQKTHSQPINKQQLIAFIQILSQKIDTLTLENHGGGLKYLQIGHESSYEPPKIVETAVNEAKIRASSFGLFPYKTAMKIYNNGQIQIGDQVFCTNPAVKYYGINTNFDKAPLVTISGDKFKAIKIDLDTITGELLTGYIKRLRKFEKKDVLSYQDDINTPIPYLYTTISLSDFKGSEEEFLQLSNEQWIDILQDKTKINIYLDEYMYIHYYKTKAEWMKTEYFSIGSADAEKIGDDYYQYTTGPVRALVVTHQSTVSIGNSLSSISPSDLIIKTKRYNEDAIAYLRNPQDLSRFKLHSCNENGQILQEIKIKDMSLETPLATGLRLFSQKSPLLLETLESNSFDSQNRM